MLKTILITFTATAGALALAANLFINSILGMFGLAATSVGTLSKLQASHEVVQKMKSRQLRKQKRITKRFVKRSGKRVASGALAAATVGTVAVVAAMTTIEIADYCEEQKELQADLDLITGTSSEFDLDQCFDRSGEDAKAIYSEAKSVVTSAAADALDSTKDYGEELWIDIKAATNDAINYTDGRFAELWESATSWFTE